MAENKKYRARVHNLLLYADDPTHVEAMRIIEMSYDYAAILHDKDVYTKEDELNEINKAQKENRPVKEYIKEGLLKIQHHHYVVRFSNAKWNTAIADELGIKLNYIEQCQNINNSLLYLLHYNDSDKYQYSIDEVKGPIKVKLQELLKSTGVSEVEKVDLFINYLENVDCYITTASIIRFCLENGCWDVYRRAPSIWHRFVDEHNLRFTRHLTKDNA